MTEILIEDVITKYEEGQSPYQIAKEYDTYPNRIRRMLQKAEVELRGKSEAQSVALETGSASHPTKGRQRTLEEKLKISSSMENYWTNISDDDLEERSRVAKEHWDNMTSKQKYELQQKSTEGIRKAAKEGSKVERSLVEFLEGKSYFLDLHNDSLIPMEKLEIDIYIPSLRVIVEVDGPSHFLPIWGEDKFQKQVEYDLRKNGMLLSKGYVIIRVNATREPSLNRTHTMCQAVLDILKSVEEKFPKETERFIEVTL